MPPSGYVPLTEDWRQSLATTIMPAFVLGNAIAAILMRHTRGAMLTALDQDYVRTARAKGLRESRVILRHALRNALIPVVTLGALELGTLLSGAVLTEQVFSIPGFGKMIVDAVFNRDYPVVQGVVLVTAFLYVMLNLLADILYVVINPGCAVHDGTGLSSRARAVRGAGAAAVGRRRAAFDVPVYLIPGPSRDRGGVFPGPRGIVAVAGIDFGGDLRGAGGVGGDGRRDGGRDVRQPPGPGGDPAMGGDFAGDADRRDRAADHRLGRRSVRLAGGLRDDRRVLSVFANTAEGLASAPRGTDRFVSPVWRRPVADVDCCCACPPRCRISLRACGFPVAWRWSGAVVAEFVAGSGGFASGLAYRILEAGYRLEIPRMFAALVLLSLAGIAINTGLGLVGAAASSRREAAREHAADFRASATADGRWLTRRRISRSSRRRGRWRAATAAVRWSDVQRQSRRVMVPPPSSPGVTRKSVTPRCQGRSPDRALSAPKHHR